MTVDTAVVGRASRTGVRPLAAPPQTAATTSTSTAARWVLGLTSVGAFMVALDALVVTTALSTIRTDLGASIEALEWTINAYNLSFAVLLMTGAALGDRFGRRRLFMAGLALFTAASAACGLAPDVGWLIAARAVQGAGGALVMPMTMALLSAAYPPAQRGQALGIYAGITGLAVLGGPVVGGAVVQGASWHWIFWLNLPIGLALIGLVRQRIAESAIGPAAALDLPGLVLVTGAALGTVWSLMHGTSDGWTSPSVVGPLAVGLGLLGGFLLWEQRTPRPMVPLRLFRTPAFAGGNAAIFLMSGALYSAMFFAAQFLQTAQGHGPLDAGLRLLPWTGVLFVVGPLAGRLLGRFGGRPLLVGGLGLQALGMAWLGRIVTPDLGFLDLVAPFILAGVGVSLAMPAAQHAVVSAVRTSEIGTASGTFSMLRFLGGSFGVALSATVFAMAGGFGSPQHFSAGFAAALGVSAILSLLGALAGLGLPGRATARG